MDTTQALPDTIAESNSELTNRRLALPWDAWHDTGAPLHTRMHIMGKSKRGRLRLLSSMLVMAVVLLVFSGCAATQDAVSPVPTHSEGSGTLVAVLAPEGTNTNGSGTAQLQLTPDKRMVCFVIHVAGIKLPATAAHIHQGAAGINGPIVVHLQAPNAQGISAGCTQASRNLIVAIMQHPADYYVNVHNAPYPEGAVRGQLSV